MGRGLFSGLIWGAFTAVIAVAVFSLGTPLPERPAPRLQPGAQQPVAAPAATPAPTGAGGVSPDGARPAATQEGAAEAPAGQASGPVSEIPLPARSEFNRPPDDTEPALPGLDTAPAVPPQAVTSLPTPATPPVPESTPAPQPQATVTLEGPGAAPAVEPIAGTPAASPAPQAAEEQPERLGLPQIETDPDAQTEPAPLGRPLQPVGASTQDEAGTGSGRAIDLFAAPFAADETRPLMAVILIDDPSYQLGAEALERIDFPVTFAIDPRRPGATDAAAAYRAAGFEVMLMGEVFTEDTRAEDVSDILERGFATLPEAVAVLDTANEAIQGRREVLDGVVTALAESGHGLVAFPRGLPVAEQSADRQGVPAATLFREIDSEGERATVITRYLDRAAFAAAQEGAVIVVGHTYADTVTALFSWALGSRSESVALAPVSAVLTR